MDVCFSTTFLAVLAVYLVMGAGVGARFLGWLAPEADSSLMKLVVNLLMPCLIASKVLKNDVFAVDSSNLWLPPLLGFAIITLGIGFSYLVVRLLPKGITHLSTPTQFGTFAACAGMLNYGYVPIPLLADLFPGDDRLLAVLFVLNLGTELALWTVCVGAIRGRFDRTTLRSMISIPTVAVLTCLVLNTTGLDRLVPEFLFKPAGMLGAAAIPLSLLFVGATLADQFRSMHEARLGDTVRIFSLSLVLRLLILPALILLLAVSLPLNGEIRIVLVIYASMSSAIFPAVLTKLHGGDMNVALRTILSNSVVALVTSPLWIAFGLRLLSSQ